MSPPSNCHMPLAPEAAPSFFLSLFSSSFFFSSFPPSCFWEPFPSVLGESALARGGPAIPLAEASTASRMHGNVGAVTPGCPYPRVPLLPPHPALPGTGGATLALADRSPRHVPGGSRPSPCILPARAYDDAASTQPAPQSPAESLQEVERLLCSHFDTWLFVLQRSPLRGPRAPSTEAGRTFLESAVRTR